MIPKIIHYVWIGRNEKPELVLKCIESWKKFLPDYKILEWNEDNTDITSCEYSFVAYKQEKWAYVSDYIRFTVLNEFGGIYLDTDVEFIKPLPDTFLEDIIFSCCEGNGSVSPGLIFACEKGAWIVKEVLEEYRTRRFDSNKLVTVNEIVTNKLIKKGYIPNNTIQMINGMRIYTDDYFCSYDKDIHRPKITCNTISIHHYMSSWKNRNKCYYFFDILLRMVGEKKYKKLQGIKRFIFGIRGENKDYKI